MSEDSATGLLMSNLQICLETDFGGLPVIAYYVKVYVAFFIQ